MHSKNICITTVISLASMLTISNAAFAESKVARVYNEGQNIVAEIPYFEVDTQNTKKAYQVLLKSPSDPLSFTVDLSSLQEIPLNNNSDSLDCISASGKTTSIATAKLYIEHNATDEDTGVHGLFDDHGWSELCVYDPNGKQVLAVKPQSQLKDLTMAGIFFESREPPNSEFSIADLKNNFPEGKYNIRGISYDGTGLIGAATFSHDIPAKPNITYPELVEDEEDTKDAKKIPITNLVIRWDHVTKTITDEVVTITGYEVIVTKEIDDDPHGLSKPILDVHVLPTKNSLTIPIEFIEPDTVYELEILALEKSGNQTKY